MSAPGPLTRLLLLAVPVAWRASVARDLAQEARRAGRRGVRADLWCASEAAQIALRFLVRRPPVHASTRSARSAFGDMSADFRVALRRLRRQPWAAAAIVVTLALGIGAATATFGIFSYALFRPVPGVHDPDRLVSLYYQFQPDPETFYRTALPHRYLAAMRDGVAGLDGLAAYRRLDLPFSTSAAAAPRNLVVVRVTRGYFDVLGVRPRMGRLFTDDEYERRGPSIAVVSDWLWRRDLAADPGAIGRTILVNAQPFTIVGVTATYRGPKQVDDEDIWVPLANRVALGEDAGEAYDQYVIGRLQSGATLDQAREQTAAVFAGVGPIVESYTPAVYAGLTDGIGRTRHRLMTIYFTLMAGVAMLFLIASANAANLLLARNVRQAGDRALRAAVGASRWRLIRESLVESSLLAALAAGLGLFIAEAVAGLFRGSSLIWFLPALDDLSLDWRVAAFAAAAAAFTIVLFGAGPAWLGARVNPQQDLQGSGRTTPRGGRLRAALVCLQLGLSLALVAATGVLVQTAERLESVDLGMTADGVTEFSLAPFRRGYDDARTMGVFNDVLERLEQSASIRHAALAGWGPLGTNSLEDIRLPDQARESAIRVMGHHVTAAYLETLGIPILSGRTFTGAEVARGVRRSTDGVVIVSASLAMRLFQTRAVVGRRIADDFWGGSFQIVGVVGDVASSELRDGQPPAIYAPLGSTRRGTFVLRSSLPAGDVAALVRRTVHDVDPTLATDPVVTLSDRVDQLLVEERLFANLGLLVAVSASALAAFGVYAVVAFFVDERRREFGIRAALGAPRRAAAGLVFSRLARMAALGLPTGAGLFLASSRVLASRVYGLRASDPITLACAGAALFIIALLAAWLPAHRAARVDPIAALRAD